MEICLLEAICVVNALGSSRNVNLIWKTSHTMIDYKLWKREFARFRMMTLKLANKPLVTNFKSGHLIKISLWITQWKLNLLVIDQIVRREFTSNESERTEFTSHGSDRTEFKSHRSDRTEFINLGSDSNNWIYQSWIIVRTELTRHESDSENWIY